MIFETVEFFNSDESFSHFSVICYDSDGVCELATCIMHETRSECDQERLELEEMPDE